MKDDLKEMKDDLEVGDLVEHIEPGRYFKSRGQITKCFGFRSYISSDDNGEHIKKIGFLYLTDYQEPSDPLLSVFVGFEAIPRESIRKINDDGKRVSSWDKCFWKPKKELENA